MRCAEAGRLIRVGVADDHPVYRAGLVAMLDWMPDLRVVWTCSTVDGVFQLMSSSPVDAVIVDVNFPAVADGIAATRIIKRAWPGVKVLVMSALDDPVYREAALAAGASGFLSRGMEMVEMMIAIERATHLGVSGAEGGAVRDRTWLLTERQRAVLDGVRLGQTNREIAEHLGISVTTVNKHVHQLLRKLGVRNRAQAAAEARF